MEGISVDRVGDSDRLGNFVGLIERDGGSLDPEGCSEILGRLEGIPERLGDKLGFNDSDGWLVGDSEILGIRLGPEENVGRAEG